MPIRIAILFEFGTLNGGEHSMLSVMDQLKGDSIEFVALVPSTGQLIETLTSRGITTVPFDVRDENGRRRPQENVLAELQQTLLQTNCDLVHANSLSMGRLTGFLAEKLPMPCLAHVRDILKLSKSAIADLNQNERLVAVSEATRKFHLGQGLHADKVITLHNGVDIERFQPRTADDSFRAAIGLATEDFLVLSVGQIGLRKGQDVLAEAATLLQRHLPHAHFALAGVRCSAKQESVEFEQRIIRQFKSIGRGNHLHLLGYVDDMPRLMNSADVLVHAAHQEPLGRVLLEAAASGLPIIATDVGGTSEILCNEHSALLVPPADPHKLAAAMLRIAQDKPLRRKLAESGRQAIVAKFRIQTAADALRKLWMEALPQ